MILATLSQKPYQKNKAGKNQEKNNGKRKHRNIVLLANTTQNTGFSSFRPKNLPKLNDTPCAAADARATLLLLLLLFKPGSMTLILKK